MSWTTPRTWVTGELVTAALLNAHLRDNLRATPPTPLSPIGGSLGLGVTAYLGPNGFSTTESNVYGPLPACTLVGLYVLADGPAGAGESFTFTVRKDGADQSLTCAIAGAAALSNNDLVNTVAFTAGQKFAVKVVATGATATRVVSASLVLVREL